MLGVGIHAGNYQIGHNCYHLFSYITFIFNLDVHYGKAFILHLGQAREAACLAFNGDLYQAQMYRTLVTKVIAPQGATCYHNHQIS